MAVGMKHIIISMFLIASVMNANNIDSKKQVLEYLENKVKDSKKELSLQLNSCFKSADNNPIILNDIDFIKQFKRKDVFSFASYMYMQNLNDCTQKKDHEYIYNLAMLYSAKKDYDINATDTLEELKNYFEPIEGLERRTEYKNVPKALKKHLEKKLGNKLFDYSKAMKNIIEHYRKLENSGK